MLTHLTLPTTLGNNGKTQQKKHINVANLCHISDPSPPSIGLIKWNLFKRLSQKNISISLPSKIRTIGKNINRQGIKRNEILIVKDK